MVWKGESEKKHSMSSNCSAMQQKHERCRLVPLRRRTCCYHCIEYCARQNAGTRRYSDISLIWQKSMLGSYIITTSNQKSLLQFNIELLVYLTLASKENSSSSRGRPPKRKSLEAPTTGKKPTLWSLIYGGGGGRGVGIVEVIFQMLIAGTGIFQNFKLKVMKNA